MAVAESDQKFLKEMIAHHEMAIKMSQEYLSKNSETGDKKVVALARDIISAQTQEISDMGGWIHARGRLNPWR